MPPYSFKLYLEGATGVGKTSLLLRYTEDTFRDELTVTAGWEFKRKQQTIDGYTCKLTIWDVPGQQRFRCKETIDKSLNGVVVCYDVTDSNTYREALNSIGDIRKEKGTDFPIVLTGLKCDLGRKKEIDYNTAKEFAESNNLIFFEASAKTDLNVEAIFSALTQTLLSRIPNKPPVQPKQETAPLLLANKDRFHPSRQVESEQPAQVQIVVNCCNLL